MSLLDVESTQDKVLYLMTIDEGCVRKAHQNGIFLNLFNTDSVTKLAASSFIK